MKKSIVVIKYGGNAMTDANLQAACAADIVMLQTLGYAPILVHGGGPQIDNALQKLGMQSRFHNGIRITDSETMAVVQWVLAGQIQPMLVRLINAAGGKALGLHGDDGQLFSATPFITHDQTVQYGNVGEVHTVNTDFLHQLLQHNLIPVVSSFASDGKGVVYNINADNVAAALACALSAERVLLLTNIRGVLDQEGECIAHLHSDAARKLIADGVIYGGMIPKVSAALDILEAGCKSVQIVDGTVKGIIKLALQNNYGTIFTAS